MQRHWFKLRKKHITLFYIIGYFYMLHVVVYYNGIPKKLAKKVQQKIKINNKMEDKTVLHTPNRI
jgi:hypothetical protein